MTLKYIIKTSFIGLKTNKSRTGLTILGIVIGIIAIILIMALGKGAQNLILKQIQGLGAKTIIVLPGRQPKGPTDPSFVESMFGDSLKEKDLELLKKKANVPTLEKISPILYGSETISYQGETYKSTIFGSSELITTIFDLYPESGRFFDDEDVRARADVLVIGSKIKEELFGPSEAIGQKVKIKGRNLRVIGVLPQKGQVSFFNFDESAILPYTTAQEYIFGIKYYHRLLIEADSEDNIPRTVEDIKITLRNSHGILDPEKDDFHIETQADLMTRMGVIMDVLTLFLASVAAISLLVGGIGIMNIMLVSVTERTHEIGLRKAIGATDRDILLQFLMEAVTLTALGGVIGITLGTFFAFLISLVLGRVVGFGWSFVFPTSAVFLGLGVSAAVGLVFGLYPARQAARKSPIEALKYE